jgi:DNA-binding MarR family transcriptional regulator
MDDTDRKIRYEVFQFILDRCRPPTIQDLANRTSIKEQDVVASLAKLEDLHHLKLYGEGVPSPTPIAMVHPFSHL